jgi:hypothetical protein
MTKEILELLARCETEMRYAGWINPEADNPQRQELYIAVEQALAQPVQEPDMQTGIAYQKGYHDGKQAARARCIELVLAGSSMPIQTRTLEALQRDRKRIAKLIAEDGK